LFQPNDQQKKELHPIEAQALVAFSQAVAVAAAVPAARQLLPQTK